MSANADVSAVAGLRGPGSRLMDPLGGGGRNSSLLRKSPLGVAIFAAHVVLVYVLAMTLGIVEVPNVVKPMEAVVINVQDRPEPEPLPVVKPELAQPLLEEQPIVDMIPEIEVPVEDPPPAPAAITAEMSSAPPVGETANMKVNRRVDPIYPSGSRRDGEQGTGMFRVLVDEKGRPLQVEVLRSTGFPRLDDAAMTAIRQWMFTPALRSSQPVQSWTRVQVAFQLKNG